MYSTPRKRLPWFQVAFRRPLHGAAQALKRQGGEFRFTGCILGFLLVGFTYPAYRLRRVRRERKR
jgi:hypothetical protein